MRLEALLRCNLELLHVAAYEVMFGARKKSARAAVNRALFAPKLFEERIHLLHVLVGILHLVGRAHGAHCGRPRVRGFEFEFGVGSFGTLATPSNCAVSSAGTLCTSPNLFNAASAAGLPALGAAAVAR